MSQQGSYSDAPEMTSSMAESISQILNMIKEIDSKLTKTQAELEELKAQDWFKKNNPTETIKMLIEWYSESGDWEPLQKGLLELLPKSNKKYWQAYYVETNKKLIYNIGLSGYTELAMLLLDCGMPINLQTFDGYKNTMLHGAATGGRLQLVQALLDRGADIEAENHLGQTPLTNAAANNHLEVIKLLVQKGAKVNHSTSRGYTDMYEAASRGHVDVVQFLLQSGADVDAMDPDGYTALISATCSNHVDLVKLLIQAGANVNHSTINGDTCLHKTMPRGHYMDNCNLDLVKYLVMSGADTTARNRDDETPLDLAMQFKHTDVVEFLSLHPH